MRFRGLLLLLLGTFWLTGASPVHAKKEGFGFSKKIVGLNRLNPPAVLITGTRIQVSGKGEGGNKQELAAQIASRVGSEMVQHDPRLTLDSQRPQTHVEVTVLSNSYESDWITREGTRTVEDGKDSKGKRQYRTVNVTLRYQVVSHRFSVSYSVQDIGSKKTIYADSLEISFKQEFQDGQGAPTESDRNGIAIQQAAGEIVYRLVPTPETIQVLVPKGSFEEFVNLAEAGLWSRYSEAIEARTALPNLTDESYRQYALGLAYEALGYGAENNDTTLRYLGQAAQHYNSALSMNPKEDYFTQAYEGSAVGNFLRAVVPTVPGGGRKYAPPPLQRVQTALQKYQTLMSQNEILVEREESGSKNLDGGPSPQRQGINNSDVIAMVEGGVPEAVILTAIEDAQQCAFDTAPAGLIALTKAKVGKTVLQAIQAKSCD